MRLRSGIILLHVGFLVFRKGVVMALSQINSCNPTKPKAQEKTLGAQSGISF